MLFKSGLVTSASGSIGGTTASHNRGGMYLRARAIPVNPDTNRQRTVREAMATLADRWNGILTPAQRAGWANYAEGVLLPGPLGDPRNIGAIGMYQRSNIPRIQAGLPPVDDAPSNLTLAPMVSLAGTTVTGGSANITLVFNTPAGWSNVTGNALLIYTSRPYNPGVAAPKGPFRFAGAILGDTGSPPASPATLTSDYSYTADQRIRVQARLSLIDGRLSSISSLDLTVT